jgi:hypothetical protein
MVLKAGAEVMLKLQRKLDCGGARLRIRDLFVKYDADQSGDIDVAEFQMLLQELGMSGQDAKLVVPLFDTDGDGEISYQEFVRVMKGKVEDAQQKFLSVDQVKTRGHLEKDDTQGDELLLDYEKEQVSRYRYDGNLDLYTEDALTDRRSNLDEDRIQAALETWWGTFTANKKGTISKKEVIEVHVRICKALFDPEEWSLKEATAAARADWAREQGKKKHMSKEAFFLSLFETVDLWTEGVSLAEYERFLTVLYNRITMPKVGGVSLGVRGGQVSEEHKASLCDWCGLDDVRRLSLSDLMPAEAPPIDAPTAPPAAPPAAAAVLPTPLVPVPPVAMPPGRVPSPALHARVIERPRVIAVEVTGGTTSPFAILPSSPATSPARARAPTMRQLHQKRRATRITRATVVGLPPPKARVNAPAVYKPVTSGVRERRQRQMAAVTEEDEGGEEEDDVFHYLPDEEGPMKRMSPRATHFFAQLFSSRGGTGMYMGKGVGSGQRQTLIQANNTAAANLGTFKSAKELETAERARRKQEIETGRENLQRHIQDVAMAEADALQRRSDEEMRLYEISKDETKLRAIRRAKMEQAQMEVDYSLQEEAAQKRAQHRKTEVVRMGKLKAGTAQLLKLRSEQLGMESMTAHEREERQRNRHREEREARAVEAEAEEEEREVQRRMIHELHRQKHHGYADATATSGHHHNLEHHHHHDTHHVQHQPLPETAVAADVEPEEEAPPTGTAVLFDFASDRPQCLQLSAGQTVVVTVGQDDHGWCWGIVVSDSTAKEPLAPKAGFFPAAYVADATPETLSTAQVSAAMKKVQMQARRALETKEEKVARVARELREEWEDEERAARAARERKGLKAAKTVGVKVAPEATGGAEGGGTFVGTPLLPQLHGGGGMQGVDHNPSDAAAAVPKENAGEFFSQFGQRYFDVAAEVGEVTNQPTDARDRPSFNLGVSKHGAAGTQGTAEGRLTKPSHALHLPGLSNKPPRQLCRNRGAATDNGHSSSEASGAGGGVNSVAGGVAGGVGDSVGDSVGDISASGAAIVQEEAGKRELPKEEAGSAVARECQQLVMDMLRGMRALGHAGGINRSREHGGGSMSMAWALLRQILMDADDEASFLRRGRGGGGGGNRTTVPGTRAIQEEGRLHVVAQAPAIVASRAVKPVAPSNVAARAGGLPGTSNARASAMEVAKERKCSVVAESVPLRSVLLQLPIPMQTVRASSDEDSRMAALTATLHVPSKADALLAADILTNAQYSKQRQQQRQQQQQKGDMEGEWQEKTEPQQVANEILADEISGWDRLEAPPEGAEEGAEEGPEAGDDPPDDTDPHNDLDMQASMLMTMMMKDPEVQRKAKLIQQRYVQLTTSHTGATAPTSSGQTGLEQRQSVQPAPPTSGSAPQHRRGSNRGRKLTAVGGGLRQGEQRKTADSAADNKNVIAAPVQLRLPAVDEWGAHENVGRNERSSRRSQSGAYDSAAAGGEHNEQQDEQRSLQRASRFVQLAAVKQKVQGGGSSASHTSSSTSSGLGLELQGRSRQTLARERNRQHLGDPATVRGTRKSGRAQVGMPGVRGQTVTSTAKNSAANGGVSSRAGEKLQQIIAAAEQRRSANGGNVIASSLAGKVRTKANILHDTNILRMSSVALMQQLSRDAILKDPRLASPPLHSTTGAQEVGAQDGVSRWRPAQEQNVLVQRLRQQAQPGSTGRTCAIAQYSSSLHSPGEAKASRVMEHWHGKVVPLLR